MVRTFAMLSVNRLAGLALMVGLLIFGFTTDPIRDAISNGAGDTEILIVDLTKKLPSNPYQEEYEQMLWPTVRIKTPFSTGSGVIFTAKNAKDAQNIYILSAAHVVGDNSEVTVEIFTAKSAENAEIEATVLITDTNKDLALLATNTHELTRIYSARLAPSDYKYYLFTPVWTVGCSLGLNPRPSFGHFTSCSFVSIRGYEISAPILPGNSGGPVFDANTYEVIGIAIWVQTYQGQLITTMAGVVPITEIYEFLNSHRGTEDTEK